MKKVLKNIIIIILLVLIAIIIWFVFDNNKSRYIKKEYPINGVSMSIKEGTLTNTGATFILKNNSNINVSYGNSFSIEIKENGNWQKIDKDLSFTLPAFDLKAKTNQEIEINWEFGYGALAKGEYRLIKDIHYKREKDKYESFSINVEFNIE